MKKIIVLMAFIFFVSGCTNDRDVSYISEDNEYVSISYPVTNINVLDEEISSYVNKTYYEFKNMKYENKPELNISYTYKEINDDTVNVSLKTEIITDKTINKIKTFTYNKSNKKFLSMEDLVDDLESLDLRIDIDTSKDEELYFSIKKKNIAADDKVVALTFDDGPSKYTASILDVLKKYDACATFFVVGNRVPFYGNVLRRTLEEGNEIGNHSYDHKLLTRLSKEDFQDEVNKTQDAIKKATGFTPTLFRPTYGGYTNTLKSYTDLRFVLWDVDSRDWEVKSKDKILKNVLPNVKSGSIILMHDGLKYGLNALEDIIKDLKDKGYKFVTISELLEFNKLWDNE